MEIESKYKPNIEEIDEVKLIVVGDDLSGKLYIDIQDRIRRLLKAIYKTKEPKDVNKKWLVVDWKNVIEKLKEEKGEKNE